MITASYKYSGPADSLGGNNFLKAVRNPNFISGFFPPPPLVSSRWVDGCRLRVMIFAKGGKIYSNSRRSCLLQIFFDMSRDTGTKTECNTGLWLTPKGISAQLQTFVILKINIFLFLPVSEVSTPFNSTTGLTWDCALKCVHLWYDKHCTYPGSWELDGFLLGNHLELKFKIQSMPLWFN